MKTKGRIYSNQDGFKKIKFREKYTNSINLSLDSELFDQVQEFKRDNGLKNNIEFTKLLLKFLETEIEQ